MAGGPQKLEEAGRVHLYGLHRERGREATVTWDF